MSDLIHANFLVYQSEDGSTRVDVQLDNENIWLNQKQLAELFGKAKGAISEHIRHIFEDGELTPPIEAHLAEANGELLSNET